MENDIAGLQMLDGEDQMADVIAPPGGCTWTCAWTCSWTLF
nr:hypothetical protein [Micromonospora sp. DSM 115978]